LNTSLAWMARTPLNEVVVGVVTIATSLLLLTR
jgi:hypothetical protein